MVSCYKIEIGDTMPLKGKPPEAIEKRLKLFLYGKSGVGKTTAAISFPNVYYIDCEKGGENDQYIDILKANNALVFQSNNFAEIMQEIRVLRSEKHDFKTLIIDPVTTVYEELCEIYSTKKNKFGQLEDNTGYGAHYKAAKLQFKSMFKLLLKLDMNIILIAHAKKEYADGEVMKVIGNTFNFFDGAEYIFDLVLEARKIGKVRTGHVIKTRVKTFEDGEAFDFSFDAIANKYGRESIFTESVPVAVGTAEELKELTHLITILKINVDEIDRWYKRAGVDALQDIPQAMIVKIIESLRKRIETKESGNG